MESELVNLQTRVAELEAALAAISKKKRRADFRQVASPASLICAVILVICVALGLTAGAAATSTPQGPTRVPAPFQVIDHNGQILFSVQAEPGGGGGAAFVFTKDGLPAAVLLARADGNGGVVVMNRGTERASLGVAGNAAGVLLLDSATQAKTQFNGAVGGRQTNGQGQPVAQWGPDDNGNGYFMAGNRAGSFLSKISVASDGSSGRVEVSQGGEIKVLMGVLENGKGDVCANGDPGKQVCMSGLAVKSLIRY